MKLLFLMRKYFQHNGFLFFIFSLVFVLIGFLFFAEHVRTISAQSLFPKHLRAIVLRKFRPVCDVHVNGMAWCLAHVVTDTKGSPLAGSSPFSSSYGPAQFHAAYNLPCTPGGTTQSACATPSTFGEQTIALITAYNAPHIASDLSTYSSYYGLPQCTTANGCLTIVNQNGGTSLPSNNGSWALETSLDVETAHMICQTCKILLVEANDSYYSDLGTAVNTAARLGATEISNSYGGSEWSGETSYDSYYSHSGIAITASSGDSGYGAEYPASSNNIVAVGGTTLQLNTDNTYANENVWSDTGSGCSAYESANTWQKNLSNWGLTNCGGKRAVSDVAADADPNTGAAVYDSTSYDGMTGWFQVGGTSLASPIIAGVYALAGGIPANTIASSLPYLNSSAFHDITQGSNGSCGTIMCNAGSAYDGPTGVGSPFGIAGFTQNLSPITSIPTLIPTAALTPTAGPTPTSMPTPTQAPIQTFTFGYSAVGAFGDIRDANRITGSRFETGAKGTLQAITVYVGSIQSAPNNQYQLAIYTDNNGTLGALLAKSATGTLKANSWNTLSVSAALNVTTYYWLMYNTNATNISSNNLRFSPTSGQNGAYSASSTVFGTWPTTFTARKDSDEYSIYATYTSL